MTLARRGLRFFHLICLVAFFFDVRGDFNVVVLHTNDVHGRVEQTSKYSTNCSESDAGENKCYAGVARRHTSIKQIRDQHDNVLLLDAGDQFQGTVWFLYYEGLAASHFMNRLGYDAMTLGNHEFDNGVSGLLPFVYNATFPILACNVDFSKHPEIRDLVQPYTVRNVSGEKIGIIGYITQETVYLTRADKIETLAFLDEVTSIRTYVERLTSEGVNKIIALGHAGYNTGLAVAKQVTGVDIVVEGHTNVFLYTGDAPDIEEVRGPYPTVVEQDGGGRALLVTGYAYGKYLGMLNATFDDAGVLKEWTGNPLLLNGSYEQDATVLGEVAKWREPLDNLTKTELGETYVFLDGRKDSCRRRDCNLGNFIADAILDFHIQGPQPNVTGWSDVGIVIFNGGGMRNSIQAGKITIANVLETLPFRNEVEKVTVRGSVIRGMLEHSVTNWDRRPGRFAQMSGIQVIYDLDKQEGSRVHDVKVRCTDCLVPLYEPLVDDDIYSILTNTYMVLGGDDYTVLRDNIIERYSYGTVFADVVSDYVKQMSPIWPGEDGRISFVEADGTKPAPNCASTGGLGVSTLLLSLLYALCPL